MGRRRGEEDTRRNRTWQYPGGYNQHGYRDEDYYDGPYFDRHGERYFVDRQGHRFYEERPPNPYDRGYERDHYERDSQNTGRTAIKWLAIVAVALIAVVGMVMVTDDLTSGPSEFGQEAPQQPLPQQPQAPSQPETPSAPAPAVPGNSEELEGLRGEIAELQQPLDDLIESIRERFSSSESAQQESSP